MGGCYLTTGKCVLSNSEVSLLWRRHEQHEDGEQKCGAIQTQINTHTHTYKPIGVTLLEFPHLLWLMYNDTTPHKSASGSIHWGRFFLPSSLFHFHPLFSLCSFEPHHSLPFSVFPFRPHTLSIIPPSLPPSPYCSAPCFCPPSSPRSLPSVAVICVLQNGNTFSSFLGFLKTTSTPSSRLHSVSLFLFVHQFS